MASWGYVIISTNYRGCCGSEGKDEFGGADIYDVLNLLPALTQVPNADTSRVGIYGMSRGGMMALLAMKKSTRFKAAYVGSGMANLYNAITMRKDSMEHYVFAELIPDYYRSKDMSCKSVRLFIGQIAFVKQQLYYLHRSALTGGFLLRKVWN